MPKAFRSSELSAQSFAGIEIFAELGFEERLDISRRCQAGVFDKRNVVLAADDESKDVYFVVDGRVRATIYSVSGKEVAFRDIGAGMHFGDLAAIDGEPRSANVVTLEKSLIAWMSSADFWAVINANSAVAATELRGLAAQIRMLTERVVEFSTLGASNRLHAELLRLALQAGAGNNESEVTRPPTHAELASRISSHREAVSREMQRLVEVGIVERSRGKLLFRDLARLTAMVNEVKGG
jgi:CRP-like cAMP-binding protein